MNVNFLDFYIEAENLMFLSDQVDVRSRFLQFLISV